METFHVLSEGGKILNVASTQPYVPIVAWPGYANRLRPSCLPLNGETFGISLIALNKEYVVLTDYEALQVAKSNIGTKFEFETDESCAINPDDGKPLLFAGSFEISSNPELRHGYDGIYRGKGYFPDDSKLPRPFLFQSRNAPSKPSLPFWIYRNDFLRTQGQRVPSFIAEREADVLESLTYDDSVYTPSDPDEAPPLVLFNRDRDYKSFLEITQDGVCAAAAEIHKGTVLDIVDGLEARAELDDDFFQAQTQLCINSPHNKKRRMYGIITDESTPDIDFYWWTRLLPPALARPFDFHAILAWRENCPFPYLIFVRNVLKGTRVRVLRVPSLAINKTFMPAQKLVNEYLWTALLALPVESSMREVLEKTLKLFFVRLNPETHKIKEVSAELKAAFKETWPVPLAEIPSSDDESGSEDFTPSPPRSLHPLSPDVPISEGPAAVPSSLSDEELDFSGIDWGNIFPRTP